MSRVTNDVYSKQEELQQKRGSGNISVEGLGEYVAGGRLERELYSMWRERRELQKSHRSAGEIKPDVDSLTAEIQAKIRQHQARTSEENYRSGIKNLAYNATSPSADPADRNIAIDLLAEVPSSEILSALREEARRRGNQVQLRTRNGQLTAYGKRVARLRNIELID